MWSSQGCVWQLCIFKKERKGSKQAITKTLLLVMAGYDFTEVEIWSARFFFCENKHGNWVTCMMRTKLLCRVQPWRVVCQRKLKFDLQGFFSVKINTATEWPVWWERSCYAESSHGGLYVKGSWNLICKVFFHVNKHGNCEGSVQWGGSCSAESSQAMKENTVSCDGGLQCQRKLKFDL